MIFPKILITNWNKYQQNLPKPFSVYVDFGCFNSSIIENTNASSV